MQDKTTFQPEAFPLELLTGEEEDSTEIAFEDSELEEERGGARFRQGFSARRRFRRPAAARARPRPRPMRRPGRPPSWPRPWPPRRWPYVPWPVGGPVTVAVPADDGSPRLCPCPPPAAPPPADASADTGAPADAGAPPDGGGAGDEEFFGDIVGRIGSGIGSAFGRIAGALDTPNIIDLTAQADKSVRKGTRDPKSVYALVLHQMACCFKPKDPLKRFLSIGAHYAITHDGRILQLHPVSALVWASNGFNKHSVAVEFAGNFPSTRGKWWQGEKFGKNRPTQEQITAGRQLIRHLVRTIGLTHVLAHRQSSGTRENDPGPDIWFDVGQWAVNTLGLRDGGSGFRIGTGNPIPDEWRTWGSRRPAVTPEIEMEHETTFFESEEEEEEETEIAHDVWDREYHEDSDKELIMHDTRCGCARCAAARTGSFETESFAFESDGFASEMDTEISEEEEMELALELLAVSSEQELDQFLGKLFKGAWKGLKKVGSVVGKIAKPLGGVLRSVAKKALPLVGGALGSFIPIPGVGTAVGSALGGAIGKALEAETEGMSDEDREFEVARKFVRIARDAARQAAAAPPYVNGQAAANQAVAAAARKHLPNFRPPAGVGAGGAAQQGRWIRRGGQVVVLGA